MLLFSSERPIVIEGSSITNVRVSPFGDVIIRLGLLMVESRPAVGNTRTLESVRAFS